ncbi:MAG: hypothetical protein KA436_04475 [Oligoflexales bacterium]|nr:hypothetical protein [Oligoflexales bacterium]
MQQKWKFQHTVFFLALAGGTACKVRHPRTTQAQVLLTDSTNPQPILDLTTKTLSPLLKIKI